MQTEASTRNTYYHRHPRGFANECQLVRCSTAEEREEAEAAGYERLTRAELAEEVRHVNRANDAWGSNRAYGTLYLGDVLRSPEYAARYVLSAY